jgi:hypothetical protein
MSIQKADVVDAVGIENDAGEVILTLADPEDWSDERNHLLLLQAKLNAYLRFVESGELMDVYPQAQGRHVSIDVVFRCAVPEVALQFLEQARSAVESAGIGFRFQQWAG